MVVVSNVSKLDRASKTAPQQIAAACTFKSGHSIIVIVVM